MPRGYVSLPVAIPAFVPIMHPRCSINCQGHLGVASSTPFGPVRPMVIRRSRAAHPSTPISGKRQKLTAKQGQASEDLTPNFDLTKFINEGDAERFGTIFKNRSFIKEKGFHHPDDFFRKTIANKGWWALCQPPRPAATSVVREFYANLASYVVKKVRVHGVLVDFSA